MFGDPGDTGVHGLYDCMLCSCVVPLLMLYHVVPEQWPVQGLMRCGPWLQGDAGADLSAVHEIRVSRHPACRATLLAQHSA